MLKSEYFKNGLLIKLVALIAFACMISDTLFIMTYQMTILRMTQPSPWIETVFWSMFVAVLFILGVHVGAIPQSIFGGLTSGQSTITQTTQIQSSGDSGKKENGAS
jgi:hypothetical protein